MATIRAVSTHNYCTGLQNSMSSGGGMRWRLRMYVPNLPRNHIISNAFMPITHQSAQVLALMWVRKSQFNLEALKASRVLALLETVKASRVPALLETVKA